MSGIFFGAAEVGTSLNTLGKVGEVTGEQLAGNIGGESVHALRIESTSAQVGNGWEISHVLGKRHEQRGLHIDASPCLVDRAVCRSAQKQKTPRWRLEEGEKVGNEKSDLSWNLPGGAHTQGQTALHK
jgi:hypothetical protein